MAESVPVVSECDDHQLIEQFLRGDERSFNLLVERHRERIYLLIWRMVRNREDALDLSQEVFVKAYRKLKSFRHESNFYTWLYRIAVNLALNFAKREKFRSFLSLSDLSRELVSGSSPSEEIERNELSSRIDQAVMALPEKQRMVFILRHYEEMSVKEVADLLGKSEGTIKANYFQAVRKLRRSLKSSVEGEE
jgi:RNA polymerase sigma-70 factor (ECF subfamily)